MKHVKTVVVPASEHQQVERVTCDLCNSEIKRTGYDADEVEIRHRTGHSYPEGGSGAETTIDMCGQCFDEKLVPWLRSQGANPTTTDWDY